MTRRGAAGRRAGAGAIGLAALLGLTLGACSQSNTPEEYNTLTQQNFLESCTNFYFDNTDDTLGITENTVTDDTVVAPPDQNTCQCMYEAFAGPEGSDAPEPMPINSTVAKTPEYSGYTGPNFTDLNADLKSNPDDAWNSVPQNFKDDINACSKSGGSGTTTTTAGGSTTTTAGDTTTTS